MELSEKVALVVNSAIGSDVLAGPGREGYEVARDLLKNNQLGKIYCLNIMGDCDLPLDKVDPYCKSWYSRQFVGLVSRIHRRFPIIRGRRRIEQWIDSYFSKQLSFDDGGVMYCPKPLYPLTVKRAKELGMKVALETSVLHPRFNLEVVGAEKRRLGMKGAAGYTDEKRVKNIEAALERCDKIFAWSSFIRDSYIKYGVPEDKFLGGIEFSPPGIDTGLFSPDKGKQNAVFTVLHVSSISVIKGVQYLLDAWERVADEIEGQLIVVGPADRDMRVILKKRRIKNYKWVGRVSNPVEYFQSASVFVSPSLSDAGPRTVLESMACGVPAIVSNYCGVSRLITDGENGFVYRYDDVDELASKIRWAYDNRDKSGEMGERAYEMVKDYSVMTYASDVEKRLAALAEVVA